MKQHDTKRDARKLWRPKRPELPTQCASCPFRTGNDAEFGRIVARLLERAPTAVEIQYARLEVLKDLRHTGDFMCHGTVYTDDMCLQDETNWRQCPGASACFRGEKLKA